MGKIFPIILGLVGLGAGIGAGIALKPAPQEIVEINPCGEEPAVDAGHAAEAVHAPEGEDGDIDDIATSDFVKMNNQFVVPVVSESAVQALVVMSLSLEMDIGGSEIFYQREPKLRDGFLQVLFDHANAGGFDGVFTNGVKMNNLRAALLEVASKIMGPSIRDVLVTDILRQDI